MSIGEDIGAAIGRTVINLSTEMGSQFKGQAKGIASEMADYRDEAIPKMNEEAAAKSIDVNLFRTKEMKTLVIDLKKRLKHSPGSVADWFNDTLGGIFSGFYDLLIGIIVPEDISDFEEARSAAGYLTFVCADVVILVAVLDVIATACSLTLVRNLVHIGRLFISTFGLDRYIGAVIAPALQAGLVPRLQQGFNERYQSSLPGSSDLVRMELREVFRPEFRDELLVPETTEKFKETMRKHGYNDYWSDSYWAAHWVLPSLGDLDEMLHRGIIDEEAWETMVRRNDYLPAWIPQRKMIIYNPYTRVDARRMWDLRILSEEEVKQNYKDLGYDNEHADKMTLWTKVYVLSSELSSRYSKGWISQDEVKQGFIDAGMYPDRAEELMQKIVKANGEERTATERDLTKAEIVKGVKKGLLTAEDGVEMLMDLGYSEDEAWYIITINVEASSGSPEAWSEFQDIVNKRRKSQGLSVKEIPDTIKDLEQKITKYEKIREEGKQDEQPNEFFIELDKRVNPLKRQLKRSIRAYRKEESK